MLSRRELMTAGVAGSLYPTVPAAYAEARDTTADVAAGSALAQEADREGQREIKRSIDAVEATLERALLTNSVAHGVVSKLRANMETFFRGNSKFPDFTDIGISVFWDLYDWHIKNRQQLVVSRGTDGRYYMQFMFTTMLLRHEVEPNYIGIPYDKA